MDDRVYKFGEFELAAIEGELRSGETVIRLQEKPLLLLRLLLDHSPHLVSRQQLRHGMWDGETFVGYEQGINVAVKKVRDALGDSADCPRYIQTVAKKGYRLLPPVEIIARGDAACVTAPVTTPEPENRQIALATLVRPELAPIRWGWIVLAIAVVTGLGAGFSYVNRADRPPKPIRALAVLPLRNLSPDPGQEYFSDGVTEELITDLAQSLPLRVISRTSVMRYKQTSEPVSQIARDLGVEAIVEGAVARSGNRVTVTVQLIDATEDRHLWAKRFDRNAEDILAIESDLSEEIAEQVGGALASERRAKPAASRPVNAEVYDLCLMGRYFWNKRTEAGLTKAIEYFEHAIREDPNYAPAYAGLADSYVLLPSYSTIDREASLTKAEASATKAITLDEALSDAHAALAFVDLKHWQTRSKQAKSEFDRALELNPNYATAHQWLAYYWLFAGNLNEAVSEMGSARQLDPLSAIINADEGQFLYASGNFKESRVRLRQAIELAPDLGQPHETLALIDLLEGTNGEALIEAQKGLQLDSTNPRTMAEAGYVLASTGHTAEARKLLQILSGLVGRHSAYPIFPAFILLGLGERARAVEALAEAAQLEKASGGVRGLAQWPIFDQLGSEPRYRKVIAEAQ